MPEATDHPRRFHIDWKQWCYPGPRRAFTPEELARAGDRPWPSGMDLYVYVNMLIVLVVNPTDLSPRRAGQWLVIGLAAIWVALKVARWLWANPSRKRLNLASYGAALGLLGLLLATGPLGVKAMVRNNLAAVVALLTATLTGWWMLTLYRAQQIEARLRELDEQAERERLAARLGAAQIQPHFLFNPLASLQHWVETGDARAAPLLRDFSAYLRATLPMFERELQPLADELALVRSYLAIMQARLGERLRFHIEVDPLLATALPPGVLLTLVENAIRHGIEPQLSGGSIEIKAQRVGQLAVLSVRDDGAGLSPQVQDGVGLSNTRRRLQQAFGDAASLTLADARPGCLATLKLPA
jgi:signal transduction histidine kinase